MIRFPRFAVRLAGVLLAVLPLAATAMPPTADDIASIKHMFGFDELIRIAVDRAFDAKHFSQFDETQLACIKQAMAPVFNSRIDEAFARTFVSHEYVGDWQKFADTAGGGKFMGFIQKGMAAVGEGLPPPPMSDLAPQLSEDELAQVNTFMQTPAAAVVSKGMPDLELKLTPEMKAALIADTKQRCSISLDETVLH